MCGNLLKILLWHLRAKRDAFGYKWCIYLYLWFRLFHYFILCVVMFYLSRISKKTVMLSFSQPTVLFSIIVDFDLEDFDYNGMTPREEWNLEGCWFICCLYYHFFYLGWLWYLNFLEFWTACGFLCYKM